MLNYKVGFLATGRTEAYCPKLNQLGMSIVELTVAAGISTAVVLGTLTVILKSASDEQTSQNSLWLQAKRFQIQTSLSSDAGVDSGFHETLRQNSNMACFQNGGDCSNFQTPQNLVINLGTKDAPVILDGNNSSLGLTARGDSCSFDLTSNDKNCIYKLKAQWQALCESAACKTPQPKMTVTFTKKMSPNVTQDEPKLAINVFKNAKLQSLSDVCASMGGTLGGAILTGGDSSGAGGTSCNVPAFNTSCTGSPLGPYLLGFNADGSTLCGQLPNQTGCGSGIIQGYRNDGSLICGTACL